MTTAETLRAARELIADPERWCQYVTALGRSGREVAPAGRAAVAWCAIGALRRTCARQPPAAETFDEAFRALDHAAVVAGAPSVATLNDHRDHAAVMAMFDRAIEEAEGD